MERCKKSFTVDMCQWTFTNLRLGSGHGDATIAYLRTSHVTKLFPRGISNHMNACGVDNLLSERTGQHKITIEEIKDLVDKHE